MSLNTERSLSTILPSRFEFAGKHLLASYAECRQEKLTCVPELMECFRRAVIESGATILSEQMHVFPNGGMTAVMILSESHASIHTYPEHSACFVDIFTCGEHCYSACFDKVIRDYLEPQDVSTMLVDRGEKTSVV